MSDPMRPVEIEDVLSSIRRLVSDDPRPAPAAMPVLILTPALRVMPEKAPQVSAGTDKRPAASLDWIVSSIGAGVSDAMQEWEPETGDTDVAIPPRPTTTQPVESLRPRALSRSSHRAPDRSAPATEPLIGTTGENDAYLDEGMLRDMVRALILEELGGAMGEKITRNVRKLVRAEIARALTVRDLD